MASSSSAIAAKSALKALADGLSELAEIQKTWGFPKNDPDKRWLHVGEVTWSRDEWVTNRSREEDFKVRLVITAQITASSPEEAETVVMEYAAAIEAAILNNPSLGLSTVVTSGWTPEQLNSWAIDGGYEAQLVSGVNFKARTRQG